MGYTMKKYSFLKASLLVVASILLINPALAQYDAAAEADYDDEEYIEYIDEDYVAEEISVYDPIEPFNRAVFRFNNVVDMLLLEPASKVYTRVLPPPARTGIGNFLSNLRSPLSFANELLQLDFKGAGTVASRFIINTLAGWGGVFDPAERTGLVASEEDFGQTLAVWGVSDGPYLVLPLLY
jgi:ABC-type transporter lipoprotein component MlaA